MRALLLALTVSLFASAANADDPQLIIKDHKFQPERLEVPAGVKFRLMVRNNDPTAEEFESFQLNREKVVPPGKEIPVFLGPLDAAACFFFVNGCA